MNSKPPNYILAERIFALVEKCATENLRLHPTDIFQVIQQFREQQEQTVDGPTAAQCNDILGKPGHYK